MRYTDRICVYLCVLVRVMEKIARRTNGRYQFSGLSYGLLLVITVSLPGVVVADCVVLLHGLARTSGAMKKLVTPFEKEGHQVINVDYPSRKNTIEQLAPLAVNELGYSNCDSAGSIHFVTHSMGGILVRYYLAHNDIPRLGRVVMLAPPNQGSEVVDKLRNVPGFKVLNGEAGLQLGTDDNSIPVNLGPVEFELGIIAGRRTFNIMLSQLLPNPDDGKVSVASTRVAGMADHITMPVTHTFMMKSKSVIEQAVHFIGHGQFK